MTVLPECPFCSLTEDQKKLLDKQVQHKARQANKKSAFVTVTASCPGCRRLLTLEVEN